jgi:hypothetical protein
MPGSTVGENFLNFLIDLAFALSTCCHIHPIEKAFSQIKHFIRRNQDYYGATKGDGILYDMLEVLDVVTPEDATLYIVHAGYF